MRRLENYVRKYGPEFGPIYYHVLQSQAAHAGVSARLRRKLDVLLGKAPSGVPEPAREVLPLFPETDTGLSRASATHSRRNGRRSPNDRPGSAPGLTASYDRGPSGS
jgi:hypothetical protein